TAEHRVADATAAMRRFVAQVDAQGGEAAATPEMGARADHLAKELRDAKDEQRRAEGALDQARKIATEEAEFYARSQQSYDSPPGGFAPLVSGPGREHSLGSGATHAAGQPARWVRTGDGRPAVVGRGERFADHPVVADHANVNSRREQ